MAELGKYGIQAARVLTELILTAALGKFPFMILIVLDLIWWLVQAQQRTIKCTSSRK